MADIAEAWVTVSDMVVGTRRAAQVVMGLATVKLAMTLARADLYGWQRDELYYLDSSKHLAWGFVDYPPVTPFLLWLDRLVLGTSLVGARLLPALAGAGVVLLTGLMARRLGGGPFAQFLAAFAALICPMYVGANILFQTVSFDQLMWVVICYLLVALLVGGDQRWWVAIGIAFGVALETKYQVLALGLGVAAGVLLTSLRKQLLTPWPWIAVAFATLLFLPNLAWQAQHAWPSLEYTRNHQADIANDGPRYIYVLEQLLLVGPQLLPLLGVGVWWLFRTRQLRLLGWVVVVVEVGLFTAGGKSYYPGPIYALLFAAGAVPVEGWLRWRWSRIAAPAIAVGVTAALLPVGLPVLSTQAMADSGLWRLRKDFADMYGWSELADTVAQVYDTLPAEQRGTAMILTDNYGEAGAIDLYGPARGLPTAVSGHLSYYYWLPPEAAPQTLVVVGIDAPSMAAYFAECRQVSTLTNGYDVRNEEWGKPVLICEQPRRPLAAAWADFKTFR